jgi:hypothetical protein
MIIIMYCIYIYNTNDAFFGGRFSCPCDSNTDKLCQIYSTLYPIQRAVYELLYLSPFLSVIKSLIY